MANKWTSFNNVPDGFQPDTMILLTDGSVLVHNKGGKDWRRLTPDSQGKYESGTWSAALNMTNTRQYFASGVQMDGRVFAIGGEYSDAGGDTPLAEIFDPLTNTWSSMNKPVAFNWINGDAAGCVLADGRVLLGTLLSSRTELGPPPATPGQRPGWPLVPAPPRPRSAAPTRRPGRCSPTGRP